MKHGLNILFCLLGFGLMAACDSSDPCPDGWMTFFVDEQAVLQGSVAGMVCDGSDGCEDQTTRMIPGFWGSCLKGPSLCGAPNAWVCMQPGAMSYELKAMMEGADPSSGSGTFNIPPVDGSNCRLRAYVNSSSPHLQTLSCGSGRFYGPDAQFGEPPVDEGSLSDPGMNPDMEETRDQVASDEGPSPDVDVLNPCGKGVCQPTWLGDGSCDAACNCEATKFDGRDCTPPEE